MRTKLTCRELARMIDLSAVKAESTEDDVRALAEAARKYRCVCAFTLPSQTRLLAELLANAPETAVGGVVGFPGGGTTSSMKRTEALELLGMGCNELDMVINVGMLRSGRQQFVEDDIRHVVQAAGDVPVKVILECHWLTNDQIRNACELCVNAGAAFVKTGTGWAPTGATLENIALMKSCVGDACGVKAAGGVRDLETLLSMHRLGATRFGIGLQAALKIFEQSGTAPGGDDGY